jgi:hypothetical protein
VGDRILELGESVVRMESIVVGARHELIPMWMGCLGVKVLLWWLAMPEDSEEEDDGLLMFSAPLRPREFQGGTYVYHISLSALPGAASESTFAA